MVRCEHNEQLSKEAEAILAKVASLTKAQLAAFLDNDQAQLMQLDKELELAVGAKERCLGALREHQREHNCGGIFNPQEQRA